MDLQEIDATLAHLVEVGDYISFDGAICAVKEITEVGDHAYLFISEDDRDIEVPWDERIALYGYV